MGPNFSTLIPKEKNEAKKCMKLANIKSSMIFPLMDYDSYEGNVINCLIPCAVIKPQGHFD